MDASKLTVCVVGTGSIGLRHLKLLQRTPGLRVLAAPHRATRAAELSAMGIECVESVSNLKELSIDAAVIASDTSQHVVDALRFKPDCALLIEKPLAIDACRAEALSNAHKSAHVACVLRFNSGLVWLRERLGALGRIQLVDAECLSWLPSWRPSHDYRDAYSARPSEGGVLRDLIHEIDYLHWLFGPAASVAGSVWNTGQLGLTPELDEAAAATIATTEGLRISLRLSFATRPATRRLRVWGEHGQLTWDGIARRATHVSTEGTELEVTTWEDSAQMYADQMASWIQFIRNGASSQLATLNDGIAALRVIDALRESSSSREEIRLS